LIADAAYLNKIWSTRFFWLHLAWADIRAKYRRSVLGIAWALIQPFSLTLLFTFIMGNFFHVPMGSYAIFIFSGLIFWEFIVGTIMAGCHAFINAEGYIRQCTHPLLIYSLRSVIASTINLMVAFCGLMLWVLLWRPELITVYWFSLLLSFSILFLFAWPLTTIAAFLGTRFRDFSQLIQIILQVVYYISAILFLPDMYKQAKIDYLIQYNPIYHLLNLFRKPVLDSVLPSADDYLYVFAACIALWSCTWLLVKYNEKKVIYYL